MCKLVDILTGSECCIKEFLKINMERWNLKTQQVCLYIIFPVTVVSAFLLSSSDLHHTEIGVAGQKEVSYGVVCKRRSSACKGPTVCSHFGQAGHHRERGSVLFFLRSRR